MLDAALRYNVVNQSGAWFAFNDEKIAQGRDNCLKKLKEDAGLYSKILASVRESQGLLVEQES